MAPRLLLPLQVDAGAEAQAADTLRTVSWEDWSDADRRTFLRAMQLARIDLSVPVRTTRARITSIEPHLRELLAEGGGYAVSQVISAISLQSIEMLVHLAAEMKKVGDAIRSLKNLQRLGKALDLPPRLRRAIDGEVRRRLRILEKAQQLAGALELNVARRDKQGPQRALPIVRLADVFVRNGFSKRQAFIRTAALLHDFDPARYPDIKPDQVRLRYQRWVAGRHPNEDPTD